MLRTVWTVLFLMLVSEMSANAAGETFATAACYQRKDMERVVEVEKKVDEDMDDLFLERY